MCILLTSFQKIDGPGPPLGNSLNERIGNDHLTLGVEALSLHAESAKRGPGTVPVHVFTQQTITALSCQPGGSITFTLKSLQCAFTYQSLHCKGPVNNCAPLLERRLVLSQEQGWDFASFNNSPLTAMGAKWDPDCWKFCLPWNLNVAERVCAATGYLCTSEILEKFPLSFLLPEEKYFRQHRSIGWGCHGLVIWKVLWKDLGKIVSYLQPPPFLPLLCQKGRGSSAVVSAQQRHSDLSWRLYLSWNSQRGASGHELALPTILPSVKWCLPGSGGHSAPALLGLHFGVTASAGLQGFLLGAFSCSLWNKEVGWDEGPSSI